MINFCGQDIQIGDYVGLGVRQGNGTEHRVGRVLGLTNEARTGEVTPEWRARCLWYEHSAHRRDTGYVYESKQKAEGLFKLDPATIGQRERICLDNGYRRVKGPR